MKHTDGSWKTAGLEDVDLIVDKGGKHIAKVDPFVKEWKANCILIASAPGLLAMLEKAVHEMTEAGSPYSKDIIIEATKVIKKAKGVTNA